MGTGEQFIINLSKWAAAFEGNMDALARQTCQQIAANVVQDTPVDTGFLRSSWQPSIGKPPVANAATRRPGAPSALATVAAVAQGVRAGDVFWMINNTKYGPYVEFGTTKMAGRFFVTSNVKRAQSVVAKLMQELK